MGKVHVSAVKIPTEGFGRVVKLSEMWTLHAIQPEHLIDYQFGITLDAYAASRDVLIYEEFEAFDQSEVLSNVVGEAFAGIAPAFGHHIFFI